MLNQISRRGVLTALAGVAVALVLVWGAPADAQKAAGLDAIRQRMDAGQALFLAGSFERAAETFERGYAQFPYSAFLFNAAVSHEKAGNLEGALANLEAYLQKDPSAPDADDVRTRVVELKRALSERKADSTGMGGAAPAPRKETLPQPPESQQGMKSLVVIETEPPGAPVSLHKRLEPDAARFAPDGSNPGWKQVAKGTSPLNLTLDVGRYHIVVDEFQDFNRSETDIDVSPGHVHQFKANLSQGAFMGFLKVKSNVLDAYIYLDDDGRKKTAWGKTPHGELVQPGEHTVVVEAPGYQAATGKVEVLAGDRQELDMRLQRLDYGVVRLDSTVSEVIVSADGKPIGRWRQGEPALEFTLPAGEHELRVSAPGHKTLVTRIDVPGGQIQPVRAKMIKRYPRGAAWTQAAIAAALIGTSIYFGVESNRLEENLRADREAGYLSSSDPRIDRGFAYSIGADAGFVLGGLFAGLSTYNFIKDPYPDSALRRGKKLEFERNPLPPDQMPTTVPPTARPNTDSIVHVASDEPHGGVY